MSRNTADKKLSKSEFTQASVNDLNTKEQIKQYIFDRFNPANGKNINIVEITLPQDFVKITLWHAAVTELHTEEDRKSVV